MFDKIKEECGVFGVYDKGSSDVARTAYYALYALQHRGQESCGIAVNDGGVIHYHKDVGLVPEVFNERAFEKLGTGNAALGHVRYSTTGTAKRSNVQPMVVRHIKGTMALAHNGNLTNAFQLRQKYEMEGGIFHTTSDTEIIAYAIVKARLTAPSIEKAVAEAMQSIKGAYSFVLMSPTKLIAARDPNGYRPLCMGKLPGGGIVFSSETCALDSIGAHFIRDIEPGEVIVADESGVRSFQAVKQGRNSMCVFEFVYFARPDSEIAGVSVHEARKNAGRILAREHPVEADVVIGVPDSGLDAALGYSLESGIPYEVGFIKNRYVGRTFIQPTQGQRTDAVRVKLNVVRAVVSGKRVIMIDDSIVRGTTSRRIVRLLREAGAKEVHMRISSPPFVNPCYFGTDIDSKDKLIACRLTIPEIAKELGVDSLGYLSVDGVNRIADGASCGFCDGCFTGNYPSAIPEEIPKDKFEHRINA